MARSVVHPGEPGRGSQSLAITRGGDSRYSSADAEVVMRMVAASVRRVGRRMGHPVGQMCAAQVNGQADAVRDMLRVNEIHYAR
jgi:hypothetical protein